MDRRIAGNDDGPVRQSVRTDRSDHDGAQRRFQNRSARGKSIGGGSRGCGDNQSISPVSAEVIVTNISFQIDDTAASTFGDHRVVEHAKLVRFSLLAVNADL